MKVPSNITKCVGFLSYFDHEKKSLRPVGSAFFLGRDAGEKADPVFIVTARHVIEGLRNKGVNQVHLILNLKDGAKTPRGKFTTNLKDWYVDPDDESADVAIYKAGIASEADHLVFPISLCLNEDIIREMEVGLGDNVFIAGLFKHHFGKSRNVPIVRTGNLSAFDDEKISTKDFGDIDAFLIEARSIGGLSGSPVMLNLGHARSIGGQVKFWNSEDPAFYLMGLIHGHYDSGLADLDSDEGTGLSTEKVNTGIAIVVPYYTILKVIEKFERQMLGDAEAAAPTS